MYHDPDSKNTTLYMKYNTWLGPLPGIQTRNIKAIKTVIYCSLPPIPKPGLWKLKPTNRTWPMLYSYHLQYILGKTKMCDSVSIFSGVSFSFWGHFWGADKCVFLSCHPCLCLSLAYLSSDLTCVESPPSWCIYTRFPYLPLPDCLLWKCWACPLVQ